MTLRNSPRHLAFEMEIDELFALASDTLEGEVATDEQEAGLADLLDQIRQAEKDAEAARKEEKQPHLDAGRKVDADWKPGLDKAKAAISAIKDKLTGYRVAKQRAAEEAARMAREEAEAKMRTAQAKLAEPEHLQARFDAEAEVKDAQKLAAQANKIDRAPTGLRTRQIAVVEDREALLQHVMKHDPAALTAWLENYAQRALPSQLPGVRIEIERRAA